MVDKARWDDLSYILSNKDVDNALNKKAAMLEDYILQAQKDGNQKAEQMLIELAEFYLEMADEIKETTRKATGPLLRTIFL